MLSSWFYVWSTSDKRSLDQRPGAHTGCFPTEADLSWSFHPHCLFFHGYSEVVLSVCFGAHTWALLCHSSKQRPSAAAVSVEHLTGRSLRLHMDYLFRVPLLLLPSHIQCLPWCCWPHCMYNNPNRRISTHGLVHSDFFFFSLVKLPQCICVKFSTSSSTEWRYFCPQEGF